MSHTDPSNRCPCSVESTCGRLQRRWANAPAQKSAVFARKLVRPHSRWCGIAVILKKRRLGMYALRERRQHVTQEDFEFAVAKVCVFTRDASFGSAEYFSLS